MLSASLLPKSASSWLLEVNETPAYHEGEVTGPMAQRLFESAIPLCLDHMQRLGGSGGMHEAADEHLVKVLDETDSIGKCNITSIITG